MIRFACLTILSFLSCFLFSCDDSEETPDVSVPEVTIVSPQENQKVHGQLSIEATAEDLATEMTMKVFVDGTLLKEGAGDAIEASLDTKTLAEGMHAIKISATDKAGNTSEETVNVKVQNTLFTLQIPSNYISQYTEIYFALFRNDGTRIAFAEAENETVMTVPTPDDFNLDSTFVFVEYFYLNSPSTGGFQGNLLKTANYYVGINAGDFKLAVWPPVPPTVGTHTIKVTDIPLTSYSTEMGGMNLRQTSSSPGSGSLEAQFNMTSATSDFFFALSESGASVPRYHHIAEVRAGETTEFSYSGLPEMQAASFTTKDAEGHYSISVSIGSDYRAHYGYGDFTDGKIPFFFPNNAYPQYLFWAMYTVGDYTYFNNLHAATPPASFQYLDATVTNVNYANRQLKLTKTGTFDLVTVGAFNSTSDATMYYGNGVIVYFPESITKVILPTTPPELASIGFESPTDYDFASYSVHDYMGLSGDHDYQTKVIFSADGIGRGSRDQVYFGARNITPTHNGRKAKSNDQKIPEDLKPILRDRLPVVF